MRWFTFWLILHVISVVAAFGPTYTLPLIAAMGRKDPDHGAFAVEVSLAIAKRFTMTGSIASLVTGIVLIFAAHVDLFASEWLLIALVLYAIAMGFSMLVQTPNAKRMLEMLKAVPPGPPAEGAPVGPAPEMMALGKKLATGGQLLALLSLAIFVLMIWRPGAAFGA